MGKREANYIVTHSYAPDPDLRKVQAALDLWATALAEQAMVDRQGPDPPIAQLPPARGTPARGARRRPALPADPR